MSENPILYLYLGASSRGGQAAPLVISIRLKILQIFRHAVAKKMQNSLESGD
jgi:hypothetical protein